MILSVSGPVFNIRDKVSEPFNNFFSYFENKKKLEEENDSLRREILNLKIEILSSQTLKSEYDSLRGQIKEGDDNATVSKVVLRPPFSGFDNLILNGNFSDSNIGQKIFYRNIVLGEIVEVRGDTAIAKLLSASGQSNVGKLKDGNQIEIFGRGSGQYEIILPKDLEVSEGDPIIYPDNEIALYGVVDTVFSTEDDLFNQVLFNIPIDFSDINYVRIDNPLDVLE